MSHEKQLLGVAVLEADVEVGHAGENLSLGLEARRVAEEHVLVAIPVDRVQLVAVQVVLAAQRQPVVAGIHYRRGVHLLHEARAGHAALRVSAISA